MNGWGCAWAYCGGGDKNDGSGGSVVDGEAAPVVGDIGGGVGRVRIISASLEVVSAAVGDVEGEWSELVEASVAGALQRELASSRQRLLMKRRGKSGSK